MEKNKLKILIFALTAVMLFVCTVIFYFNQHLSANANSAIKSWHGSYAAGAIAVDENCPVTVESELLTFNINEFPDYYYGIEDEQTFLSYNANVTASYSFYNPADYDVSVTLAFPFGRVPSYLDSGIDDSVKYVITADGKQVERTLRHTLSYDNNFDTQTDLAKLIDGFAEDEFYYPEMPVYKYVFGFDNMIEGNSVDVEAEIDIPDRDGIQLAFSGGHSNFRGTTTCSKYVQNGDSIEIYSIGGELDIDAADWKLYYYRDIFKRKTDGNVKLVSYEQTTFKQLALTYFDEEGAVSESDWYNAVVGAINSYEPCLYMSRFSIGHYLMRWYEYSLSIPAKGRLVNNVTAPLYPDIDGYFKPSVYSYEYLLSPAKGWAEFGSLEVRINTPFFLIESYEKNFEQTEYGYVFYSEGLPEGELNFQLCSSSSPEREKNSYVILNVFLFMILGFILLSAIVFVGGIIFIIVYFSVVNSKKRKENKS